MGAGAGGYVTITLQTLLSKFGEPAGHLHRVSELSFKGAPIPDDPAHQLPGDLPKADPGPPPAWPPAGKVGLGGVKPRRRGRVQPVRPPRRRLALRHGRAEERGRHRGAGGRVRRRVGRLCRGARPRGRPLQARGRYHPEVPDQAEGEEAVPGHSDRHGLRHRPLRRPLSPVRDRRAGDRREGRHERHPAIPDEVHHEPGSTRRPCRDRSRAGPAAARLRDDPEARRQVQDVELCRDASAAVLVGRARGHRRRARQGRHGNRPPHRDPRHRHPARP